eukprot:gene133-biopygen124
MQRLLRTHKPTELEDACEWFDCSVSAAVMNILQVGELPRHAELLAPLPLSHGGRGLRKQGKMAQHASSCVGAKGAQREITAEKDSARVSDLNKLLSGAAHKLVRAFSTSGSNRVLVDPKVVVSDGAFRLFLRQRLQHLHCCCSTKSPLTNAHMNTCRVLNRVAFQQRHNRIRDAVAACGASLGLSTKMEAALPSGQGRLDVRVTGSHGV